MKFLLKATLALASMALAFMSGVSLGWNYGWTDSNARYNQGWDDCRQLYEQKLARQVNDVPLAEHPPGAAAP